MTAITRLAMADVLALNAHILGHDDGLLDEGKLAGALGRVEMAAHYEGADLIGQAARLLVAVALAHAFVDGNKRTGFRAAAAFWELNGLRLPDNDYPALAERLVALVAATGGREDEGMALERWLRDHLTPR